jgi:UDP-N-acetylmuramoylalanine--D-glutamate ligase
MDNKFFKNKKVLVMGLGLHGGGVGVAKFLYKQGAKVSITDLKTEQQLSESIVKLKGLKIKYTLGRHEEADFLKQDFIVKNPDVPDSSPYLEFARKNNILIETDISLFFKLSKAFIIGITGTKGKSTTASLIFYLLKSKYKKIFLAGNIGVSPLEILSKLKKESVVILELSSFELEDLKQSPNIAVVTNILADHLNRYGSMADYVEAKKVIFKYQNKKDTLILNRDDKVVSSFAKEAKSKVLFFSINEKPKSISLEKFKLFGNRNLSNLMAAIKVAELMKVPKNKIEESIKTFKGVSSRQEFIKEVKGVKYFNDTTATMPEAVITAIDTFAAKFPKAKLIFICGGQNKGLQYDKLARKIKEKVDNLIMLPGTASDKIKEGLQNYKELYEVSSMQQAVLKAEQLAKQGDIAVLSPGGSSFNIFKNEFDRGEQFVKAVKDLK